ncbi:hypothetical protein [Paraglaciecola sp. 25GB23A]|uniref:hypothetical protein n=1 Tax=Paraglaciecola sp. 25GB23A TaxID=3156068 RepID=UPI0032AFF15C
MSKLDILVGVAVTKKTLAASKAIPGRIIDGKAYLDPFGYGVESAIKVIDESIDTANDLIVRIGGTIVLPRTHKFSDIVPFPFDDNFWPMKIGDTYLSA